jgi:hypothetical protein
MAVYVDNMQIPWRGMVMSHMMADELEELHEMADRIGLKRAWFQAYPEHSIPHYDVHETKRQLAIKLGAIEEDAYSDSMQAFRREWRRRARAAVRIWNANQGRVPSEARLVDRTTPYGNRYTHEPRIAARNRGLILVATREEAVEEHRRWIWGKRRLSLRIAIRAELAGKDLVCHCVPLACHAYTVAEIANGATNPYVNR